MGKGVVIGLLPLDQRASSQPAALETAKLAVYEGFRAAAETLPPGAVGIIADELTGAGVLRDAAARGFVTACAIGSIEDAATEIGHAASMHARDCTATYWKVIVRYNPGGVALHNARQLARARRLVEDVMRPAGVPLMCDLVVPPTASQIDRGIRAFERDFLPGLTARAVTELMEAGVTPDAWVIEAFERRQEYEHVVSAASRGGRNPRCVVRAAGYCDETTGRRMAVGLSVAGVVGVVLGRHGFWEPATEWVAGRSTRAAAVATVASHLRHWVARLAPATVAGALLLATIACSSPASSPSSSDTRPSGAQQAPEVLAPSPYDSLPPAARERLDAPFTGDFDEMVKRRLIRAGVVFNRTQYFIDKGVQRGFIYESIRLFEDEVNKRLNTGGLKVHVAFVPLPRDQLFPALEAGKVDFVAAALTITPERRKVAEFSRPTRTAVSEIAVTAPGVAPLTSADDLSGREVFVRRSSSYNESLERLNESLIARGRKPVAVRAAPEALEDDDLLEMVNAGLVEITIVDDFVAEFWRHAFPRVTLNREAAVRTNGEIAVGVRKNNPGLLRAINVWINEYGPRTAFGNMMERRYLQNADYVKDATSEAERKKLLALRALFNAYGMRYRVDSLLMAAQGYQESRLEQSMRSHVGAVGVMQVMPATGRDMAVGDITRAEPNIHAGVKYFRFMMDEFYRDEPMDELNKALMTLASYNAGPGRIRQLRAETGRRGLDPNLWFGNVERIVSERIGRETVQYVSNIFKYYVAYRLVTDRDEARARAKQSLTSG